MTKHFVLTVLFVGMNIYSQDDTKPKDFDTPPKLQWYFQTKGPMYSPPIVDEGIIYVASTDSTVYALQADEGKLLHSFKTGGDIRSQLAVRDGCLAVVSGNGKLYLLNKKDLSLIWSFSSRGDRKYELYSFADYFQSSPLFQDNRIFFGSGDGFMYCVDIKTGARVWEFPTGDVVHSKPVWYDNTVYFGSYDGFFYAVDGTSGKLVWKFKSLGQRYFPKGEMSGSPLASEGMVFAAGRDYNIYALDAKTGQCLWNKQFPNGWALAPPVIMDSLLYVGTSDDKALFALDPYTGKEKWKTGVAFNVFGAPAFSESLLYVATLMGRIYALKQEDGSVVWKMDSELYAQNHLTYFKHDDGYRGDIQQIVTGPDGFLKMYYALGAIFSKPLIYADRLVVTSTDGRVYSYTH